MWKAFAILLLLGLCLFSGHGVFLYAQEDDWEDDPGYEEGIPFESDWEDYRPDLYTRGDQTFTISLGAFFPTVFLNYEGKPIDHHFNPPIGMTGWLAYTYFFGPHFFLGGEAGFKTGSTLAKNMIFIFDIGVRTGFQFVFRRFEFPVTLTVGFAPQRYLNLGYVGLFVKGGGSVYFRFNPDWSFGVNADWTWYPQWPMEGGKPAPTKNVDANTINVTLSARYHF
jgi:hypothetical protein